MKRSWGSFVAKRILLMGVTQATSPSFLQATDSLSYYKQMTATQSATRILVSLHIIKQ